MSFEDKFVSMDMFGHPVGVHYKGDSSYRTKVGSLFTLFAYMIVGSYTLLKVTRLATLDNPEKSSTNQVLNMNTEESRSNWQTGQFDLAFQLVTGRAESDAIRTFSNVELIP